MDTHSLYNLATARWKLLKVGLNEEGRDRVGVIVSSGIRWFARIGRCKLSGCMNVG